MEIILSQNLSVYTDRFADGIYSLSGNMQRCGDVRWFYWRNDRGIQTEIAVQWRGTVTDRITEGINPSVILSGKTIICTHLPTLSSFVSSSSSFLSHLSPPKLQPTTHPNSPLFSTWALKLIFYILYVVTISVSCRFYHFFCK